MTDVVENAVRQAVTAARTTAVATPEERASWLDAVAAAIDTEAEALVELADAETHLGRPRLPGELARTTAQLRRFAGVVREGSYLEATIDHPDADATPPIPDLRRLLVPLGPVAVFAASNFPFAFSVLGGDTASALAAGNPVVVKAHEGHPRLSRRTLEVAQAALAAAGAPDGLLTLVEGREEGVALVRHPRIRAVGFTGSVAGGRHLFDVASSRPDPIPFYGELGSLNPVVVTAGAMAARAEEVAEGLAGSFTMGAGQFCTKPGLVLTPRGSGLAEAVAGRVRDGAPLTMLNDRIADGFREGATRATSAAGVQTLAGSPPEDGAGATPVVVSTSARQLREQPEVLLEEVFGPLTLVAEYDDEQDLMATLALVPGSLTGTLHAEPDDDVADVLEVLAATAGRVLWGGWPTGVAVSPAQHHGGPYPATTTVHTSVGTTAIRRFLRPVAFQTTPQQHLPPALQESNPWGIARRVDGVLVLP